MFIILRRKYDANATQILTKPVKSVIILGIMVKPAKTDLNLILVEGEGQKVEFTITDGEKGPQAENIVPL